MTMQIYPEPDWSDAFLATLADTANVSASARAAGIHRSTAYERRAADPAFAAQWDDAIEQGLDDLAGEARRRAFTGVDEPHFYEGSVCGHVRKYSDTLMTFLLAAHRPRVYGKHAAVEHSGAVTIRVEYADGHDADPEAAPSGPDEDPPEPG
jgi:hypothetical protein